MKKLVWAIAILAALVAAGAVWQSRQAAARRTAAQAGAFERVRVTRQDLELVVSAAGSVKLSQVVNVRPTVSGTVTALYVKVGDRVRQGQPLIHLDDADLKDRVAQAREALRAAETRLAKAKADYALSPAQLAAQVENAKAALAAAEQKLAALKQGRKPEEIAQLQSAVNQAIINRDSAKADHDRMKELYAAQAITQQQYEAAQAKYLTAEEAVTQAQKKLAAETAPPDPGEMAAAEAQVAQARANLEVARQNAAAGHSADQVAAAESALVQARVAHQKALEDLAGATIRAPVAGVVIEITLSPTGVRASAQNSTAASPLSVGDTVAPESGWVTIADPALVEVHVPVDETDIAKVKMGQPARVTADALEDRTFAGTVTGLAPSGVLTDGVVTFDVTVAIRDPEGLLRANMTTNVDLILARRSGVLVLPKEAVLEQRGHPAVQVAATGDRFRRVETGLSDDTRVEITTGLSEGDTVLVPRPQPKPANGANGSSPGRRPQPGGPGGLPRPGRIMIR
jgi:HlyD family secretion protein